MDYTIVPIAEEHIPDFHTALDVVAREGKYLSFYEAPPLESTAVFVRENIRAGIAQRVILSGGKVAGWCDICPRVGRPANLHVGVMGMGLLPAFRGRGIGRALLQETLGQARAGGGLARIELDVLASNAAAIALYRKLGFEPEGLKKKAHRFPDGTYDDVYIMALVF